MYSHTPQNSMCFFLAAKTQTHTAHTLSTPAVWYCNGKRKTLCTILLRYIRYVSSDLQQFHPHMQACAYCVCGRVFVCEYVRAGKCVYDQQMHTCSNRVCAGVAAGALSRACDICTHVITHNKGRNSIGCLFTS